MSKSGRKSNGQFAKRSSYSGGKSTRSRSGATVITRSKFGKKGGFARSAAGFISMPVLMTVAAGAVSATAVSAGLAWVSKQKWASKINENPIAATGVTGALAFGLYWLVKKFAPRFSFAAAVGGLTLIATPLVAKLIGKVGIKGLAGFDALPSVSPRPAITGTVVTNGHARSSAPLKMVS